MYHTCRLMCMGSLFGRVEYFDCTFFPHSDILSVIFSRGDILCLCYISRGTDFLGIIEPLWTRIFSRALYGSVKSFKALGIPD